MVIEVYGSPGYRKLPYVVLTVAGLISRVAKETGRLPSLRAAAGKTVGRVVKGEIARFKLEPPGDMPVALRLFFWDRTGGNMPRFIANSIRNGIPGVVYTTRYEQPVSLQEISSRIAGEKVAASSVMRALIDIKNARVPSVSILGERGEC